MIAQSKDITYTSSKLDRVKSLGRKVRSDFRRLMEMEDFLDTLEVMFHSVDEDGVILWANQYELNVLGYNKNQFIGKSLSDFILDKEALKKVRAPENQNGSSRPLLVEVRCSDGSLRSMYLQVNLRLTDSPEDSFVRVKNSYMGNTNKLNSFGTSS